MEDVVIDVVSVNFDLFAEIKLLNSYIANWLVGKNLENNVRVVLRHMLVLEMMLIYLVLLLMCWLLNCNSGLGICTGEVLPKFLYTNSELKNAKSPLLTIGKHDHL